MYSFKKPDTVYIFTGIVLVLMMHISSSTVIQFSAGAALFAVPMVRTVIEAWCEPFLFRYL